MSKMNTTITRRTALWTTPVIVAIVAAPAAAAASPTSVLSVSGTFTHSSTTVNFNATVTNSGVVGTTALQIAVTLSGGSPGYGNSTSTTPTGWSAPVKSINGNDVVFTYTANSQLGANASVTFAPVFTIPSGMSGKPGTGTAVASATGASSGTTSNSYT